MSSGQSQTIELARLRYVAVWLVYACMRAVVLLPFRWQLALGRRCGDAARLLFPKRRRIAARNLEVCFPELSESEREALLRAHFRALGTMIVETAMAWFGSERVIRRLVKVEGEEHLRAALKKSKGVILFTAHLTALEFVAPVIASLCPLFCGMFKLQRNPVMNAVMTRGRERSVDRLFDKDNVRAMLRSLADNAVVWYAADQSYARKGSAPIPFFDEPAMTSTAISRIARTSGATVLPCFYRRLADDSAYVVNIEAPLEGLPSDDAERDVRRLTQRLEEYVRLCPEQYLWIHRRFKGRPARYPDIYSGVETPG